MRFLINGFIKSLGLIQRHREIIVRVIADIVIINVAILVSMLIRFLQLVVSGTEGISIPDIMSVYKYAYIANAPIFSVAIPLIFYFHGIYTRTRGYVGKFKILVVFRAVTILFLFYGFLYYLVLQVHQPIALPRGVLVMGYFFTLLLASGARATKYVLLPSSSAPAKQVFKPDYWSERVLVIGGCGYIGSILCRSLLEQGYAVRVLDNLMFGKKSIEEIMTHEQFEFQKGDFRDVQSVVHAMKDVNKVVHLGAIVGDSACAINSQFSVDVNFAATRMIVEVAKGYGVEQMVFASTCSVYGAADNILDEHSTVCPVSLYAETKIDAEETLIKSAGNKFSPVVLRFATLFGFSKRPRFDLVVNLFTAQAYHAGKITVINGEQWRPFIHIKDAVEAIATVLNAPLAQVKGQIFNVGGNDMNYRISELGDIIAKTIPGTEIIHKTTMDDRRNYRVSFDKISREIGFHPTRRIEDGILEITEAFKHGKVDDYKNERYSNVAYTRRILEKDDQQI